MSNEKVEVLDDGFVRMVATMGNDLSVVNAARVSFGKQKNELGPRDEKLIKYLWDNEHTSPFRHAYVQFHIKAPIFVLRQWMKHQVGSSWNEISGRYVKFEPSFYCPENWREQHESNKQGSKGSIQDQKQANELYKDAMKVQWDSYQRLIELGVCKEQARMLLPVSTYSECFWTSSLQSLMHFLHLREDAHAQWEIQQYAKAVRKLIEPQFPICLGLGI
jgi:thymidylate synthase (FAD)